MTSGSTQSCGCFQREIISEMSRKDLTGQRFGRLIAIRSTERRYYGGVVWECKCDCGKMKYIAENDLNSGRTQSCGCLQKEIASEMSRKDLTSQRFGRLIAIRPTEKSSRGNVVWECKCDCGEMIDVAARNLNSKDIRSCGCLRKELARERGLSDEGVRSIAKAGLVRGMYAPGALSEEIIEVQALRIKIHRKLKEGENYV